MVHFATLENIAALVFLVLFTLFTAWMTVVAYRDGKDGHIECLKKD